MSDFYLRVFIENQIIAVKVNRNDFVCSIFPSQLKPHAEGDLAARLSGAVVSQYDALKTACLDKSNQGKLNMALYLKDYFPEQPVDGHVHIVVELGPHPTEVAVKRLNDANPEIFKLLQLTVASVGKWTWKDVARNNCDLSVAGDNALMEFKRGLDSKRWFVEDDRNDTYLSTLRILDNDFHTHFTPHSQNAFPLCGNREFVAFSHTVEFYLGKVANSVREQSGSTLKASTFTSTFAHGPFIACMPQTLVYKEGLSWGFPVFVRDAHMRPGTWCSHRPKSDSCVISERTGFPYLICQIDPDTDSGDHNRMLLQAVALVRVAHHFYERESPEDRFILMAIVVTADFTAQRYLLEVAVDNKVTIVRDDFDLTKKQASLRFLHQLFNHLSFMEEFDRKLPAELKQVLAAIDEASSSMIHLSIQARDNKSRHSESTSTSTTTSPNRSLDAVRGGASEPRYDMHEIEECLSSTAYTFFSTMHMYPHLMMVLHRENDSRAYLKFVREGCEEIQVIQSLDLSDERNHTIPILDSWEISGGSLYLMPSVGVPITECYEMLPAKLLYVVQQAVEGIAFLHSHNVAHLDIKPDNILFAPDTGVVTIIDFGLSKRVQDILARTPFSPIRADLWSFGQTLYEVFVDLPSIVPHRDALLAISAELCNGDPFKRPSMNDVLTRILDFVDSEAMLVG
ncbi:Myosin light chain kinase, smooth muscle [Grifola frondosa]|uniref:Myosin light chain kinase, smooth muscle n=1 Tax=Grifola frondosa TaxID=5627 RepID=A0A1C7MKE0_GRIFR|nr:Myosin light chain kinase, smooth muscle [Grifola frondosa]